MSKERVKKYGEVFTPIRVVNEMLDNLEKENPEIFTDIDKTFLEPTCGTGNFVVEIYRRKLNRCRTKDEAERALRSLWCIELLPDNMAICRQRVKNVFHYYDWDDLPFDEVFEKQFLIGDSLNIQQKWINEEKSQLSLDFNKT